MVFSNIVGTTDHDQNSPPVMCTYMYGGSASPNIITSFSGGPHTVQLI